MPAQRRALGLGKVGGLGACVHHDDRHAPRPIGGFQSLQAGGRYKIATPRFGFARLRATALPDRQRRNRERGCMGVEPTSAGPSRRSPILKTGGATGLHAPPYTEVVDGEFLVLLPFLSTSSRPNRGIRKAGQRHCPLSPARRASKRSGLGQR